MQEKRVERISCLQGDGCGIYDLRVTSKDGRSVQAGCSDYKVAVLLDKPLQKIVTTVRKDERFLYSVEFFFKDGTRSNRMGAGHFGSTGRAETLTFLEGEELLAAELYHGAKHTLGVTWIKWCPEIEDSTMNY